MVTDRPDQTESAEVITRGFVQVEIGSTFLRDDEGGVRAESLSLPETLARVGLSDRFELRLGWDGAIFTQVDAPGVALDDEGIGDASVGFKVKLRDEGGGPAVALLAETSVPVGDDELTSDAFDPSLRLSVAHTLDDRLSLGWNVGVALATEIDAGGDEDTLSAAFYTVALGIGISERTGAFIELFGDVALSGGASDAHSIDGGFTYLFRPAVQLDVFAGFGLSSAAADAFVGLGISFRLPR